MDITLDDIVVFEPRLVVPTGEGEPADRPRDWGEISVSWAASTRPIPPHLPPMRGGEIVLVSSRAVSELGSDVPALLREAHLLGASAAVLPLAWFSAAPSVPDLAGFPLLGWIGEMSVDTETAINRKLTECRGRLYRTGSELERQLADVAAAGAGLEATVRVASLTSELPVVVLDAAGRRLAGGSGSEGSGGEGALGPSGFEVRHALPCGAVLLLGPLRADQQVDARFFVRRMATAVEAALRRDEAIRPRGNRRVEATESLLAGEQRSAGELQSAALALGLDVDGLFVVAVSRGGGDADLARALSPIGSVYPAGGNDERRAAVVAVHGRLSEEDALRRAIADVKRRWAADRRSDAATLALSAPSWGVLRVPAAAREARFLASLQAKSALPHAASFESIDDVGVMRLLYELRESSAVGEFVSQSLGDLARHDSRGTLRATLRAYLESGGSQVDAANRLGIHRNTLTYRLRRIGELVGRDVFDPNCWLTLHLALRASEMFEAGDDA